MSAHKHEALLPCIQAGDHLKDCDADGFCNACGLQDQPSVAVVRVTLQRGINDEQTDEEAEEEHIQVQAVEDACGPHVVVQVYSKEGHYLYTPSLEDEAPILGAEDAGVKARMASGYYDKAKED